jgi:hypothetical protein
MIKVADESVRCYKEEALENPKKVVRQKKLEFFFTEAVLNTNLLVKI